MSESKLPFVQFPVPGNNRQIFIDVTTVVAVSEARKFGTCKLTCAGLAEPIEVDIDEKSVLVRVTSARERYNEIQADKNKGSQVIETLLAEIVKNTTPKPDVFDMVKNLNDKTSVI